MEFFDKLSKKASETYKGATEIAKGAGEKTTKIAKEAKLKMKIGENKSKIDDLYQEMGKKVYQKHIADEELSIKNDLEEECKKIDELSDEIEAYNKEILELSKVKTCVNCKETIAIEAKFCPKCGAEQPEIEKNDEALEPEVVDDNISENNETSNEESEASDENQENVNDSENNE